MKYQGRSTYSLESLEEFQRLAARIRGRKQYLISRGSYFITAFIFAAMAVYAIRNLIIGERDFISILLAIAGTYLALRLLQTGVTYFSFFAKRAFRSIPENGLENFFSFEENHVVVGNRGRSVSFRYQDMVDTVYESEKYFFLFIGWRNGYILDKSGLEGGDIDGFRSFLEEKLGHPIEKVSF